MMFAVTLSFLIFTGSIFELMGHLITSTLEASLGADFYALATDKNLYTMINDGPIDNFLNV